MSLKNRLQSTLDYWGLRKSAAFYPQMISTEITNHCNLDCIMCPHGKMTREVGVMPLELFKKIIDEVAGKTELVYLYGLGESTLVKNFPEYAQYAKAKGLSTCLSTNATALTEDRARDLVSCGVDQLILAIDGSSAESYESVRRGADFERTLQNCRTLLQAKKQARSKLHVVVQLILQDANQNDVQYQKDCFTADEIGQIDVFRIKPLFDTFVAPKDIEYKRTPCYFLWNMMAISWTGKVQFCCFDYDATQPLGDVSQQSVAEVWHDQAIRQARQTHRERRHGDISLCKGCSFPEKGYFTLPNLMGQTVLDAMTLRKLLPYAEQYLGLNKLKGRS
ncbi:MAG: radical SAM protein [Alphaproteobacteria bacterium]|nr:radical SAM protein [Alphaproteobacteria bacterium]MBF0353653.1 radical SAM protein [Alphaproteobacteria bacterium]